MSTVVTVDTNMAPLLFSSQFCDPIKNFSRALLYMGTCHYCRLYAQLRLASMFLNKIQSDLKINLTG